MPYNLRERKPPVVEALAVSKPPPKKRTIAVATKSQEQPKKRPVAASKATSKVVPEPPVKLDETYAVESPEPIEEPPTKKKKAPVAPKTAKEPAKKKTASTAVTRVKKQLDKEPIKFEDSITVEEPAKVQHEAAVEIEEEEEEEPAKSKALPKPEEPPKGQDNIEPVKVWRSPPLIKTDACNQLMFGIDSCGELGFKRIGISKKVPTPIPIDEPIKQIACGPMHTISLSESGKVYTYGCNDEGALGRLSDGDETSEATPTIVPLDGKIIKVTAGDSHSAALTDDNKIFVWGNFRDEHGSVGLVPECKGEASIKPLQLLPNIKFKDMASGSNHMLLLDTDGIVYSFGVGAQGQLGRLKSEDIGESEKAHAINADNRELFLTPQQVDLKNVDPQRPFVCDAVYAGNFSSFATNTDKKKNRLAGWGLNNYYQLGYKGQKGQLVQHFPKRSTFTCSTSMINVACGQHHTLFLTKTGRVYVAGRHEYGMLGLGSVSKEVCPAKYIEEIANTIKTISAGINTSFAVSEDGKLYSWGMNTASLGVDGEDDLKSPTEVKSLAGKCVKSVATGGSFTAILIETNQK